jgi:hypothetical protein
VIDESDLQYEKHFDPTISILFGIKIDWSDEFENASDSIRVNREFNSNTIEWSALNCFPKPCGPVRRFEFRKIIEFGIQARIIWVLLSP